MKGLLAAMLLPALAVMPLTMAQARTVKVPQAEYEALSPDQKAALADQLRDIGAIGRDDKLEYAGEKHDEKFLGGLAAGKLGMIAGGLVCKYVVDADKEERLAECAKRKPDEARKACVEKVKAATDGVGKLCDLINLKF